jgi:hypothetical protein
MANTYIVGVGMTPFGKFRDSTLASLGRTAGREALADAGVEPGDIEMISCGSARSGILHGRESGVGQLIGWDLGIEGVSVYNEKAFCASGTEAFNIANMALTSGAHGPSGCALPHCDSSPRPALAEVRQRTGFDYTVAQRLVLEPAPTPAELDVLRAYDPDRLFIRDRRTA